MATDMPAPRADGRRTDGDGDTGRGTGRVGTHLRLLRWSDADVEAAWFVGECVGAGAVLGMVAAMSRARRGE